MLDVTSGRDVANAIAVQADGKILVAGTADLYGSSGSKSDVLVMRFLGNGSPDPTFGSGGLVMIDRDNSKEQGHAITMQPDGRILVAGSVDSGGGPAMAVFRLLPDGSVDRGEAGIGVLGVGAVPAFDGMVSAEFGEAKALTLQPDGKIVVVGFAMAGGDRQSDYMVARFDTNGKLDPTFGSGGYTLTDSGAGYQPGDQATAVGLQADGRIVVGGSTSLPFFFGKAVSNVFGVVRYSTDGTVDTTFGTGGRATTDFSRGAVGRDAHLSAMRVLSDGRILVAGTSSSWKGTGERAPALARYLSDGGVDTSFGAGGTVVANSAGLGYTTAIGMTVDSSGRPIVVGSVAVNNDSALGVTRFTPAGAVDTNFGIAGWIQSDVTGDIDQLRAAALQQDGRIVAAGTASVNGSTEKVVVARFRNEPPGALAGWGLNYWGQLGDGTQAERHTPVVVPAVPTASAVSAGGYHSLAVGSDDRLWSWGLNYFGALGDGATGDRSTPVPVPGMTNVTSAGAGAFHSVAVTGGRVRSWGLNYWGQLGDATTTDRHLPVEVQGLTGVTAVAAGGYHSLAVRNDGTVWAWGLNYFGQLGDGTTIDRHVPVQVGGLSGIVAVTAGAFHSVALDVNGRIWSWGLNHWGQLGGIDGDKHSPSPVMQPWRTMAISAGALHTVALRADGSVWAWGYNGYGQVGDGTTVDRRYPFQLSGVGGVAAVAAGGFHTVVRKADGATLAWGLNYFGELGNGSTKDSHVPIPTAGAAGTPISAGYYHSF